MIGVMALVSMVPNVQAGFVSSEIVSAETGRAADVVAIQRFLERRIVSERLAALRFTPREVETRLNRLGDAQIHDLAIRIDRVKTAGSGGAVVAVAIVTVILLIIALIALDYDDTGITL